MKIKIFLASSIIEFEKTRFNISALLHRLDNELDDNTIIKIFLCENSDISISSKGKQNEYNEEIKNCDLFVAIIGKQLGQYTKGEIELAKECNKINGTKSLYFIEENSNFAFENENSEVIKFKANDDTYIKKMLTKYIFDNYIKNVKYEIYDSEIIFETNCKKHKVRF